MKNRITLINKIILLLAIILVPGALFAQTSRVVSGIVRDSTGNTVIAASVTLRAGNDSLFTRSNGEGAFTFNNVQSGQFTINITSLGYAPFNRTYTYNNAGPVTLPSIIMKSESNMLNEVVVKAPPVVTMKEDTVDYKASDYKTHANDLTEDLLKKLPGVDVDKDGNVTAQGKSVTKVRVNGKDVFGGDLKTITQNLPADLIDRIQVVDDYGDQANITGSKNGDPDKIINIEIRPDRNKGYFVNANAGVGNEGRYQASVVGNYFNNNRQISFLGNLNNTNFNVFNFGGGGGGGGGNRGGGGNTGGGGGNRGGGGGGGGGALSTGLTTVSSLGLNYRDQWGKHITTYGSYSFFNRDNDVSSTVHRENTYGGNNTITSDQNSIANTTSNNHRFNWNFEYRPDTVNYIKISPSFTFSQTDSRSNSSLTQNTTPQGQVSVSNSTNKSPNFGGNILLNHRFISKPGRNISLNVSLNHTDTKGDQFSDNELKYLTGDVLTKDSIQNQLLTTNNSSFNTNSRLLYIEPVSKFGTLEFNWNYTRTSYDNNRQTFDMLNNQSRIDSLSNVFNYSFMTNNFGLTYRYNTPKYNYSIGLGAQPTLLSGSSPNSSTSVHRTGFNLIPVARFQYKFTRTKELNFTYYGRNNEPSYTQIQPITDLTNPLNPVIGNPNLSAEFNHTFNLRFNNFDFQTQRSLFTNISANFTQHKIVANTVLAKDASGATRQEIHYLNADGYYTLNGYYNWDIPIAERKYRFGLSGSANYTNNITYTNDLENIGKNLVLNQRVRTQITPADWIDLTPSVSYTYNKNSYSLSNDLSQEIQTWTLSADGRFFFLKSFILGGDVNKNFNTGYADNVQANPLIINTYIQKDLFNKKASLKIQGYNLLNENTNVNRTITDNSTTDTRTNSLGRYFMLSFTMRLQKFAGRAPGNNQGPDPDGGQGRFRRGGGPDGGGRRGPGGPGGMGPMN